MSKEIRKALYDFASAFAQHHTEDGDDYWWGHDTDLGDMKRYFNAAERRIARIKKEQLPHVSKVAVSKAISNYKKKAIAKAIWGNSVPLWWYGSTAEYELLRKIVDTKDLR